MKRFLLCLSICLIGHLAFCQEKESIHSPYANTCPGDIGPTTTASDNKCLAERDPFIRACTGTCSEAPVATPAPVYDYSSRNDQAEPQPYTYYAPNEETDAVVPPVCQYHHAGPCRPGSCPLYASAPAHGNDSTLTFFSMGIAFLLVIGLGAVILSVGKDEK